MAASGASTLITSGWVDLTTTTVAGQRAQTTVVLSVAAFGVEAGVRLDASKVERIQIDVRTGLKSSHDYWASVGPARPDLARMGSTTTACSARAAGSTNLVARTVSTAFGSTWM